jgi:hypothetical protein
VSEATQPGLFTHFSGDVGVNCLEAKELMVELVVGICNHVVLFVGRHHQVGQRASDSIKKQPSVSTLLRLDILRVILLVMDFVSDQMFTLQGIKKK